ncbi:MAG: twin-arginine translocase TatA/TatE family subunit [Elusimicrobia bacterium]|nr:twin-arginine translocase TatA/TatE family subunit [Elusimicrobiota bacterium]
MFDMGFGELAVILAVGLLLFGAKRIPETARALGQSVKAFKDGLKEASQDVETTKNEVKKLPRGKQGIGS